MAVGSARSETDQDPSLIDLSHGRICPVPVNQCSDYFNRYYDDAGWRDDRYSTTPSQTNVEQPATARELAQSGREWHECRSGHDAKYDVSVYGEINTVATTSKVTASRGELIATTNVDPYWTEVANTSNSQIAPKENYWVESASATVPENYWTIDRVEQAADRAGDESAGCECLDVFAYEDVGFELDEYDYDDCGFSDYQLIERTTIERDNYWYEEVDRNAVPPKPVYEEQFSFDGIECVEIDLLFDELEDVPSDNVTENYWTIDSTIEVSEEENYWVDENRVDEVSNNATNDSSCPWNGRHAYDHCDFERWRIDTLQELEAALDAVRGTDAIEIPYGEYWDTAEAQAADADSDVAAESLKVDVLDAIRSIDVETLFPATSALVAAISKSRIVGLPRELALQTRRCMANARIRSAVAKIIREVKNQPSQSPVKTNVEAAEKQASVPAKTVIGALSRSGSRTVVLGLALALNELGEQLRTASRQLTALAGEDIANADIELTPAAQR